MLPWVTHFGCKYVVHGDDITSDSSGEDCYRFVKAAGRFKVVKRTPSISTTDLVGRMLLCTRTHFIKSLTAVLAGEEGSGIESERKKNGASMEERIRVYATDETGLAPGPSVWSWTASIEARENNTEEEKGVFGSMCAGSQPKPGQRVVYVDGGFDLFSPGHIEFLRRVIAAEEQQGKAQGWYSKEAVQERTGKGQDYGPAFVVAGVHDDEVINRWKGVNYPIMNIFERGLCVLQCKVGTSADLESSLTSCSTWTPSYLVLHSHQLKHTSLQHPGEHQMQFTMVQHILCHLRMIHMRHLKPWESTRRLVIISSKISTPARLLKG